MKHRSIQLPLSSPQDFRFLRCSVNALSLPHLVRLMDRLLMPKASELTLRPVCIQIEEDVGVRQMDQDEARQI
jgi:hypothetical protein